MIHSLVRRPINFINRIAVLHIVCYYAPVRGVGGIKRWCASDVWRLSVCRSRTSGISREQRGLGRPKLAQR